MAVTFNINNPDSCQRAYLNYHCYGNTMNISPADMGAIISRWGDKVEAWEDAATTNDQVEYEFDNSEFDKFVEDGRKNAKETYGKDSCVGLEIARGVGDLVAKKVALEVGTDIATKVATKAATEAAAKEAAKLAAQTAAKEAAKEATKAAAKAATAELVENTAQEATKAASEEAAKAAAKEAAKKAAEAATKEAAEEAAKEAAEEAAKEAAKKAAQAEQVGCLIGCTVGFATGLAYTLKNPNKEEVKTVKDLQEQMGTAQGQLQTQQDEMARAQENIETKMGELEDKSSEAEAVIAEEEANQQFLLTSINSIKAKQESGVQLKASERALFNAQLDMLESSNQIQADAGEEASSTNVSIYADIENEQTTYDTAAQTMGEIQGLTDYAQSMDVATAVSCGVEAAAQGLNAGLTTKSAIEAFNFASSGAWAFGATAWGYAFAAMGVAGAAMSGFGAAQQGTWMAETLKEIDVRKATQDFNTATMDVYTEEIDAFDASLNYASEYVELEVPEADDTSMFVLKNDTQDTENTQNLQNTSNKTQIANNDPKKLKENNPEIA